MGEFELIERLRTRLQAAGIGPGGRLVVGSGDDAAVIAERAASAVSVDALVEGVHFRRSTAPLSSIGHKGLATALSDLAAMGAYPGEAYVVIGAPQEIEEEDFLQILEGMIAGAQRWHVRLAGGDVTRSASLFLSLTVVGELADPADAVSRAGAAPGELVVVTGELGGAGAGLLLLDRPRLDRDLDPALAESLRSRQLEPEPRLGAGTALAQAGASAMIDLSDGLASDAAHLGNESGVRLEISLEQLPLQAGLAEVAGRADLDFVDIAISAGEDYELLACISPGALEAARREVGRAGSPLTVIGKVVETDGKPGAELRDATGRVRSGRGFDQLSSADDEQLRSA